MLIPVIAGVSFEFIRLAGKSENKLVILLSKPGMMLQKLTTREPDASMAEVAIASVEAVFDWRAYLKEKFWVAGKYDVRRKHKEAEQILKGQKFRMRPGCLVSSGICDTED